MNRIITGILEMKNIVKLNIIEVRYNTILNQLTYNCETTKISNRKDAVDYLLILCNNKEFFIHKERFNSIYIQNMMFEQLFDFGEIGRKEIKNRIEGLNEKLKENNLKDDYKKWINDKLSEYEYIMSENKCIIQQNK